MRWLELARLLNELFYQLGSSKNKMSQAEPSQVHLRAERSNESRVLLPALAMHPPPPLEGWNLKSRGLHLVGN
jgi:hypothetical protein